MKHLAFFSAVSLFLLFSFGCGGAEEPVSTNPAPEGSDTIQGAADSVLFVHDVLSEDLTGDYGIFLVDDIASSSTGLIAILDGVNATVTVLDSSGVVASAGGSGSGPGEFQWPQAVAVADDGTVAVSDFMGGFVRILEPGLESYEDVGGFIMSNPGALFVLDQESFAGMRVYFRTDDGETLIGHQTALWSVTESEPLLVYTEEMRTFSFNDFGSSIVAPYPMTCDGLGRVYTADVSTERYVLNSYSREGELLWSTQRPFSRTEKTPEEIDIEEGMVTRRMQQSEHQVDYSADPYHFAVSSLAMGPDGKLWAERPGAGSTFFDVYEPSTGEYLFSASTDTVYERLEVTPGGIFAVTSGDSQSLLVLDLASAEAARAVMY